MNAFNCVSGGNNDNVVAANEAESIPPLKFIPKGTSLLNLNLTESFISSSNVSDWSFSEIC